MWIFNALDDVPLRRMLIVWISVHAAAFLILTRFFSVNPLYEPVIPVLASLTLYLLHFKKSSLRRALLLLPATFVAAFYFYPAYPILTAALIAILAGKLVFPKTFRLWQWGASAVLLSAAFYLTAAYQQITILYLAIPPIAIPAVNGAIFGFAAAVSFLPFALRKGPVEEAYSATAWHENAESADLAKRTLRIHNALVPILKPQDKKLLKELEEFTSGILPLCSKLHEMEQELSRIDIKKIQEEISELEGDAASTTDAGAKREYEKALLNKKRQFQQVEALKQKSERTKARVIHCLTALENMRFAYANREFVSSGDNSLNIDFFLNIASANTENAYETTDAYQNL